MTVGEQLLKKGGVLSQGASTCLVMWAENAPPSPKYKSVTGLWQQLPIDDLN